MRYLVIILLLVLPLTACRQGQTLIQPPEIHYDTDPCAECNMIISDPRFACGYLHEVSAGRFASIIFDDIGDMLLTVNQHPEQKVVAWYVHDYGTEEWLDATQAFYVVSPEIHTPMAHGIAAHASAAAAEQMAATTTGEVLDWDELLVRYQNR